VRLRWIRHEARPSAPLVNHNYSSDSHKMKNVLVMEAGNHPKDAYVGPYWFIRDDSGRVFLMAHRCTLAKAEKYGEFLTCQHGHYDVWESCRARCSTDRIAGIVRDSEYEEWPRGRVVLNSVRSRFIVYADRQIAQHELQRVVKHFGIPAGRVVFMRDGHYQSTRSLHPDCGRDES